MPTTDAFAPWRPRKQDGVIALLQQKLGGGFLGTDIKTQQPRYTHVFIVEKEIRQQRAMLTSGSGLRNCVAAAIRAGQVRRTGGSGQARHQERRTAK